jgi:myo-inositol-1(or 4)-monophosphatase
MEFCVSVYGYHPHVTKTTNLCQAVRRIRILGCVSLELCYVASGKLDAFVDVRGSLRLTDVAAGKLIVEEAGGKVSDEKGCKLILQDNVVNRVHMVATNGLLHQQILNITGRQ